MVEPLPTGPVQYLTGSFEGWTKYTLVTPYKDGYVARRILEDPEGATEVVREGTCQRNVQDALGTVMRRGEPYLMERP